MKVLSLKEPWATLIAKKKKCIETRSWKTQYRGELYIHASLSRLDGETKKRTELMELFNEEELQYGKIICKCKLVDCIKMTEEYINKIKKENKIEYICGYYSVGRYAWILEDIQVLQKPISAKGKLNIWTYNEE